MHKPCLRHRPEQVWATLLRLARILALSRLWAGSVCVGASTGAIRKLLDDELDGFRKRIFLDDIGNSKL